MKFGAAALASLLAATLLAGCGGSGGDGDGHDAGTYTCPDGRVVELETVEGHDEPGFDPASACTPARTTYGITFEVVSANDGALLPGSEVLFIEKERFVPDSVADLPPGQAVDSNGRLAVEFDQPQELVFEVFGPNAGAGWTREGGRVLVGESVELLEGNHTLVDRTLRVRVFSSELRFLANGTWGPASGTPQADPGAPVVPASAVFPVGEFFDPLDAPVAMTGELEAEYWARLVQAQASLRWTNAAPTYADMYAGFACGDTVVKSEPGEPAPALMGGNQADVELDLAVDEVPCAGGPLQVAALTQTVVAGATPLAFEGYLDFKGVVPAGLAKPDCIVSSVRCMAPQLPLTVRGLPGQPE